MLEAPDAPALAEFYARVLGWPVDQIGIDDDGFVTLGPPDGVAYLAFQTSADYRPPAWPAEHGQQRMMMHLDVEVTDLESATAGALELGATVAEHQPNDDLRVMLDPAGHPFCLYIGR